MIVVRHIDPVTGLIEVANLGKKVVNWKAEVDRLEKVALTLGFAKVKAVTGVGTQQASRRVDNVSSSSSQHQGSSISTALGNNVIAHQWRLEKDQPIYEGTLQHSLESLPQLARYTTVLLTTYGPQAIHLMQLQLAIYEICANVLEHGLRHRARDQISLSLQFMDAEIRGCVQDSCKPFDPSQFSAEAAKKRSAERKNRGYGIFIIRQLLDTLQHEFNQKGNRIHFSKRILR